MKKYILIMEMTFYYLYCILLVRNKSQVLPTLIGGVWKHMSEVEIIGGHL